MPDILDIFNNDAFGVVQMTEAVNLIPNMYGRLNQLNIFPEKGITTTDVAIDIKEGVLNLVPTSPRGSAPTPNLRGTRSLKKFSVPRLALEESVKADEIQGVRAFGSNNLLAGVMAKVAEYQMEMAAKIFLTLEYMRNSALNGIVLDADGSTILNLFTEFGITQKTVNFKLTTEGEKLAPKILTVKRHIAKNLKGDMMRGIRALCSPGFWDSFITHPDVADAYKLYQGQDNPLRNDVRSGFAFQGVIWEEYLGEAVLYNAATGATTTKVFIPENSALFVPEGTINTFRTFFAPADYLETVNTEGKRLYSKLAAPDKYGRVQDVEMQSNPLPICMRPAVLVKGARS